MPHWVYHQINECPHRVSQNHVYVSILIECHQIMSKWVVGTLASMSRWDTEMPHWVWVVGMPVSMSHRDTEMPHWVSLMLTSLCRDLCVEMCERVVGMPVSMSYWDTEMPHCVSLISTSLCPPTPMNYVKIFKGWLPWDAPSKLV